MIVNSNGQPDSAEESKKVEEAQLAALLRYEILDTPSEAAFDRITQLASTIFDVPIVLISLVDKDRQWFTASTRARPTAASRFVPTRFRPTRHPQRSGDG